MRYVNILLPLFWALSCGNVSNDSITGSGVIEGIEIIVSSRANGQIIDFSVKEGDLVQKDDALGKIDDEKLLLQKEQLQAGLEEIQFGIQTARANIASAKVNYSNIKKQYERFQALIKDGSATQQQLDTIEIQYNNADAQLKSVKNNLQALEMKKRQVEVQLKLADSQLDDCQIKSPITGIILEKYKERGEFVAAGLPVFSVADLEYLWIKLYIAETDLCFVKLGDSAEIFIDSFPDRAFEGNIVWISQKAEFTPHNVQTKEARTDLVYAVKIEVANPEGILKIGMPADIEVKKN